MLPDPNKFRQKFQELEAQLSDPALIANRAKFEEVSREYASVKELVEKYAEFEKTGKELADSVELLKDPQLDPEMVQLLRDEVEKLKKRHAALEFELKALLLPKDKYEGRNMIVEIRAGTGGEEAALFVANLYRMYSKFAEREKLSIEPMSTNPTGLGGFKEVIFTVTGKTAYRKFRFESGVHRVQRVPETEASGRIHTSAVTVAVLPEAEEVDVQIDPKDLRIDVFRSSGPGGQSVNTTDSAVRVTHIPTGVVVSCQDEKSQIKNKAKALRILRSRILEAKEREEEEKRAKERREMVSTGDRSAKIRTYNFPQNRLTDHRINLTIYNLSDLMEGNIGDMVEALNLHDLEEKLKAVS